MAANIKLKKLFPILASFWLVTLNHHCVDANCKAHDASWDVAKGPTVSQPSRVDPTKIHVDWSKVVTNGR